MLVGYLEAHEHCRHSRREECLALGLESFESTMRVICDEKGLSYDEQRVGASDLVKVLVTGGDTKPAAQPLATGFRPVRD